ncbi:MAG: hypothetical protein WCT37_02630 [Patescibacteria group bacterium]
MKEEKIIKAIKWGLVTVTALFALIDWMLIGKIVEGVKEHWPGRIFGASGLLILFTVLVGLCWYLWWLLARRVGGLSNQQNRGELSDSDNNRVAGG